MKFGGGFYCGLVEVAGKDPWYISNGFFMVIRSKFRIEGAAERGRQWHACIRLPSRHVLSATTG